MAKLSISDKDVVSKPSAEIDPLNYRFLQDYVHRESGIVLDGDKHYLLEARLMPIVHQKQLESLNDLCALLRATSDPPLQQLVVDAMTTNETLFFRDLPQFEALEKVVIPQLVEQHQALRKLSFWSAASSFGQEAYSLAMMLLGMGLGDWNIRILGTDISVAAAANARAGKYMQIEVNRGLPVRHLVKYFTRLGLNWQLKDEVRNMVQFEVFDLRGSMRALGPFDVVFCKNVLIYFDKETKQQILAGIRGTLFNKGYLLLGGAETALGLDDEYERITIGGATFFQAP